MKMLVQFTFAMLVASAALLCATSRTTACTGIRLQSKDGAVVYARTLEFGFDLDSNIIIIPRQFAMQGTTESGKPGLAWETKYGATGLNGLGKMMLVDGVNEKGLASGIFYLPGYAHYQDVKADEESRSMAPHELVTWILTNFATVDEVRDAVKTIKVGSVGVDAQNDVLPLHFIVHDASGKSLVIEYLDGQLSLRDNPIGVITNSPDFDWHIKNLNNYINLSPDNSAPEALDGVKLGQLGQGSGLHGMPGDFTPASRFVRAVVLGHAAVPGETGEETVRQAFHVLDSFDIPLGSVRPLATDTTDEEYTQWTCASDTKNLTFYFHTHDNRRLRRVELLKADLNAKEIQVIPRHRQEDYQDLTPAQFGA